MMSSDPDNPTTDEHGSPEPILADPTARAKGFLEAVILTLQDQQRRIELAEKDKAELRAEIARLEKHINGG